jgi:hypothetical protein
MIGSRTRSWDNDADSVCDDGDTDQVVKGGAFSAIIPSMWPEDIASYLHPSADGSSEFGEVRYVSSSYDIHR